MQKNVVKNNLCDIKSKKNYEKMIDVIDKRASS
jgi:hypothetical protein